jgi:hypothetical protein
MGSLADNSVTPPTLDSPPGAPTGGGDGTPEDQRFLPGCFAALLIIGSCVGLFAAPHGWKFPAAVGALAAAGTLLAAGFASNWPVRILAVVFGGSITTAATVLWRPELRTAGLVAAGVGLVLLPAVLLNVGRSSPDKSSPIPAARWVLALVAGVVLAGVVGAIAFAVPGQWRWPAAAGAVAGIISLFAVVEAKRWWQRPLVLLMFSVPLTAAAVLLWPRDLRAYGVVAVAAVLFGFPVIGLMVRAGDEAEAPRRTVRNVLFRLLVGVTIAVSALSVLGFNERGQGSFAVAYGSQVFVQLGDECEKTIVFGGDSDEIECGGVQWQTGGRSYTGTVYLDDDELGPLFTTRTVIAYAIAGDDEAFSAKHHTSGLDGMEVFGFVPWWAGAPLIALCVLFGAIGGMRRPGSAAGSTS